MRTVLGIALAGVLLLGCGSSVEVLPPIEEIEEETKSSGYFVDFSVGTLIGKVD